MGGFDTHALAFAVLHDPYRFTLMRLFVCLVSDTQVPTSWPVLRIGLVDLVEMAPIDIFLGSSSPFQVELRVLPVYRCGGALLACHWPHVAPGARRCTARGVWRVVAYD